MKSPLRSTAPVLGALSALCLAVPAANAARPADAPEHPAHPGHPAQANEHSFDAGHAQDGVTETSTDTPAAPPAPANPCNQPETRRVFSPWHDRKGYVLTENGGLEKGDAGWTLADGAAVTDGNDPFFLNDAADHQSLSLPAGSSATSPATCFSAGSPTFRFVARTSGDRQARLRVEVLYTNQNGRKVTRTAGKVRGGDAWRPSKRLALAIGRGKGHGRLVSGTVAFRFTPVGAGDWQVDDLFLDPRARH
jgi:hypothetical protein